MSGIATAVVGSAVVGGYMSSQAAKKAASAAAGAQQYASDVSVEEQRRQFDKLQELLDPYVKAGPTALTAQQALIGLGGAQAQQEAISGIEQSSQFQSLVQQGENALLQNASATGGLRGGNIQSALAQYRPAMLNQMIESQYQKLNNLTSLGQASAAGVGAAGTQTASNIGNLLTQAGNAQASAALAAGTADSRMWGNIAGSIGTVAGMSKGTFGSF